MSFIHLVSLTVTSKVLSLWVLLSKWVWNCNELMESSIRNDNTQANHPTYGSGSAATRGISLLSRNRFSGTGGISSGRTTGFSLLAFESTDLFSLVSLLSEWLRENKSSHQLRCVMFAFHNNKSAQNSDTKKQNYWCLTRITQKVYTVFSKRRYKISTQMKIHSTKILIRTLSSES